MTDTLERSAKFQIGQVVKHRIYPFRGVIFDVDPTYNNTESYYEAYVSEQNLVVDNSRKPVEHPQINKMFDEIRNGHYSLKCGQSH